MVKFASPIASATAKGLLGGWHWKEKLGKRSATGEGQKISIAVS